MSQLFQMNSMPIKGGEPALTAQEIARYQKEIPGWEVIEEDGEAKLKRAFRFQNFAQALDFTNRVGQMAEQQDHHPAILTEWGKVTVYWWTHKIRGLHQNDFVMAARTDALYGS